MLSETSQDGSGGSSNKFGWFIGGSRDKFGWFNGGQETSLGGSRGVKRQVGMGSGGQKTSWGGSAGQETSLGGSAGQEKSQDGSWVVTLLHSLTVIVNWTLYPNLLELSLLFVWHCTVHMLQNKSTLTIPHTSSPTA